MTSKRLRAVKDDEKVTPKRELSLVEAVEDGTLRDQHVATRRILARAIADPNVAARDLAALTRRLSEVTREIEAIDESEGDADDANDIPDEQWTGEAI